MTFTNEQLAIIRSTGDIKINAVAGSGKTTTIIEYAKSRPQQSKILYLAFNKSVKVEAQKKFAAKGLKNVTVETAHSLAYKHIVFKQGYKVNNAGYRTNEIADLLSLHGSGEKYNEYVIANHINKFVAYFCNSNKHKIQDLNYLDVVSDKKAKSFVITYYTYIEKQTRLLLSKMDKGEINITHDFYLKKFQLSKPQLNYDYILFDEGQDASAAMLDIFLLQKGTKVIVGDTHQQIYSWRYAVNALEKANFSTYQLSTSFRFSEPIASLAMQVLSLKKLFEDEYEPMKITGHGTSINFKSKAVIARTNLGLLLKAIEFITEKKKVNKIYFEGNINSYTYADDGASLYDVLNLYNGKRQMIKDTVIKQLKDIEELEDYIEKTEDMQLGLMVEIVKEYGNEIPSIIKTIKEKHVGNEDKEKAEMIFSTVHRCKGMEYDEIHLVNDFITREKIEQYIERNKKDPNFSNINEEINLLYVAVTRTKNSIHIHEDLLPDNYPESHQIHVIKAEPLPEITIPLPVIEKTTIQTSKTIEQNFRKVYSVEKAREINKAAYQPWTEEMDIALTKMFRHNKSLQEMATHFTRTKGAIIARIKKLSLAE
ncbi:MAG: UvrD-helicase domain-containing protein [Bacteroidota bacterium]